MIGIRFIGIVVLAAGAMTLSSCPAEAAGTEKPAEPIVYFNAEHPELSPKNEIAITNAIGKWPSKKVADRVYIELECLDENNGEAVSVQGVGIVKNGKDNGRYSLSRAHYTDLPDCGRRSMVLPCGALVGNLDPARMKSIRLALDDGKKCRYGVRRILFLPPGAKAPATDEAPLRNRKDEREHAASLEEFRAECGTDGLAVGVVSSMEAVRPRAGFRVRPATNATVRLARNEYESLQVVVASMAGDLKDARVEFAPLVSEGKAFAATNLTCSPVGYVETKNPPPYVVRPAVKRPALGWWPDAILDFTNRADVAEGDVQSFWIRVKCPRGQQAGVYTGVMTVRAAQNGKPLVRTIPLSVRVNDFTLPDKSMLPLAVSFKVGTGGRKNGERMSNTNGIHNAWRTREHAYGAFLDKYLVPWDMLYANRASEPHFDVLKRSKEKGRLNMFNLSYWFYAGIGEKGERRWRERDLPLFRRRYEQAKAMGIADHAYLYGCDEIGANHFKEIAFTADLLHREFPGVKLMTTARDDKLGVDGSVLTNMDVFCPATCFWNPKQVAKSRAAGHQVWWYFCNVPSYPLANTMVETPPIEIRNFMGAQTVKFRPDGFLYYATAAWNGDNPILRPFYDWDARTFADYHGDGQWTCCGGPDMLPLPTLRLENFRDGLEDYAYAKILEAKLAECRDTGCEWAVKARAALAVPTSLVKDLSHFSINPEELYRWRGQMADLLESVRPGQSENKERIQQ